MVSNNWSTEWAKWKLFTLTPDFRVAISDGHSIIGRGTRSVPNVRTLPFWNDIWERPIVAAVAGTQNRLIPVALTLRPAASMPLGQVMMSPFQDMFYLLRLDGHSLVYIFHCWERRDSHIILFNFAFPTSVSSLGQWAAGPSVAISSAAKFSLLNAVHDCRWRILITLHQSATWEETPPAVLVTADAWMFRW